MNCSPHRADRAAAIAAGPGPVFIAETGATSGSSISEESSIARASNIAQAGGSYQRIDQGVTI